MNRAHRKRQFLELLERRGELSVEEACSYFKISPATVRRIFQELSLQGRAVKIWGGVRVAPDPGQVSRTAVATRMRLEENVLQKKMIAAQASRLVEDEEVIFVDGGSTTYQMAPFLAERTLRIVTNSLLFAHEIDRLRRGPDGAEVFLTGGYLHPRSGLLVGPEAVASIRRYQATKAFLSAGGLSPEGAWNSHDLIVEVEQAMIRHAHHRFILADGSKFGRHAMVRQCFWNELDGIITDLTREQIPFPIPVALHQALG